MFLIDFLDRVEEIREQIEEFDRFLSDQIRPLALFYDGFDPDGKGNFEKRQPGDTLSQNFVYQQVIDKICSINLFNPKEPPGKTPTPGDPDFQREYRMKIEE